MKSLLLMSMMLLQSVPSANTQAAASIEGNVVDKEMHPVAGADVSAFWDPPPMAYQPSQLPRTNTDTAGKFVIGGLAPGGYRIFVSANGYVSQTYGAKTAGTSISLAGTTLSPGPGETVRDITVRMTAAGTISGRVVSSNGDPLSGMTVNAIRIAYDASGQKLFVTSSAGTQSDDRGEYRIAGIAPGRYYLRAEAPGTRMPNELLQRIGRPPVSSGAYSAMYYPGTVDVSGALQIEVREKEAIRGINFTLPRLQTYSIRGHILRTNTKPPVQQASDTADEIPAFRPMIGLLPAQHDLFTGFSASVGPYCGSRPNCENPDGAFELTDVAPGLYWVRAQIPVPSTPEIRKLMETPGADPSLLPQPQMAIAAVQVTNSDVDGVELQFHPKLEIGGQVVIDDGSGKMLSDYDSLRIGLRLSMGTMAGPSQNAKLDAQGRFTSGSLLPGEYRLDVQGMPKGAFLVDARIEDRDVSSDVIRILAPPSEELRIRLSTHSGTLNGVVVDSTAKPAPNAIVVLVPADEANRPDRYRTAKSLNDGRFQIDGIAPGNYTAFSWAAIEDYAWFDPAVVRQYEGAGKPVRVGTSTNEELKLSQIPAAEN